MSAPRFSLQTPPRAVHGLDSSCKWKSPPIDGSLTIPQIYDWHYTHNPTHDIFVFPSDSGVPGELDHMTFSDVVPAVHRAARFFAHVLKIDLSADPDTFPTVGIVSDIEHVTYFATQLGLLRAGIPVFPITPRQSVEAISNFLNLVPITHVFVGDDPIVASNVRKAIDIYTLGAGTRKVEMALAPTFDDLYPKDAVPDLLPDRVYNYNAAGIVTSSSGSSGLPKAIVWNVKCNLQTGIAVCYGERDLCGKVVSQHALPVYSGVGSNFMFWLPFSGVVLGVYRPNPKNLAPQHSLDDLYNGIVDTKADYTVLPSFLIEMWSKDEIKAQKLASLDGIMFGGVPLNKEAGDSLVRLGGTILTTFGLTEAGAVGMMWPQNPGYDWDHFTFNGHCGADVLDRGDGTFELIIVPGPTQEITVKRNTIFKGQPAYASNDIIIPHPTKSNHWKVIGRIDDAIISSSGQLTNARHLEYILGTDPRVQGALLFGAGRDRLGAIIDLKASHKSDDVTQFIATFEKTIKTMNISAPPHGQLSKEMIIFTTPSKPFHYTLKGPVKRSLALEVYTEEISALYVTR